MSPIQVLNNLNVVRTSLTCLNSQVGGERAAAELHPVGGGLGRRLQEVLQRQDRPRPRQLRRRRREEEAAPGAELQELPGEL